MVSTVIGISLYVWLQAAPVGPSAPAGSFVPVPAAGPGLVSVERQAAGEVPPHPPDRIVYHPRRDVAITVASLTGWLVAELAKSHLAPQTCRWCDEPLNGFDAWGRRNLRWQQTGEAATLSSVTGFMLAPLVAYGLDWEAARRDGDGSNVPADTILITQSMAIAADATEILKFTVGRQRPYLHPPVPADVSTLSVADNNTSFPSGHATLAFSVVTASAEIATLRGYRLAPWIWRAGMPLAALTAYFRVAADRHYLTDVLMGAGVGSALGFGVPYLHRSRNPRIPTITVIPTSRGGKMVAAAWVW
jgi:membrane-associated phospholipid phosphatase